MVLIFSQTVILGLEGTYSNPAYFDGNIDAGTTLVITEREDIAECAKSKGIKVKGFTKQPPKQAEASVEPKPSTDTDVVVEVKEEVVTTPKKRTRKPRVKKDN